MAKKIFISGNSIVITDTSTIAIEFDIPKGYCYYVSSELATGTILLKAVGDIKSNFQTTYSILLSDAEDESGTPFTATTFRQFCNANLGDPNNGSGVINVDSGTGWAQYRDTVYTISSPFSLAASAGFTALPNNKGSVIETQLPTGVTTFYDGTKITPENSGDYYTFTIRFKATSSSVNGVFDFGIDIGGSQGIIFKETLTFPKGAAVEQNFSINAPGFTADTFLANGGIIKLDAITGNMNIYDISLQIVRIHKAAQ